MKRPSTRDHQHLLESAAPPQRPLAPAQRHAPQTRRDRRDRDRPRARRLLLGDRDLPAAAKPGRARNPGDGHTHPSQETHQLALTLSLNTSRCGWRGGPSIPAPAQQLRDSSPEQRPPGAAIDNRQPTCDEQRSWGTQPPNMSMTPVANPEDARTAPQAATTSTITTTNQTMAIHPYPLTPAPPYGRRGDHRLHGRWCSRRSSGHAAQGGALPGGGLVEPLQQFVGCQLDRLIRH